MSRDDKKSLPPEDDSITVSAKDIVFPAEEDSITVSRNDILFPEDRPKGLLAQLGAGAEAGAIPYIKKWAPKAIADLMPERPLVPALPPEGIMERVAYGAGRMVAPLAAMTAATAAIPATAPVAIPIGIGAGVFGAHAALDPEFEGNRLTEFGKQTAINAAFAGVARPLARVLYKGGERAAMTAAQMAAEGIPQATYAAAVAPEGQRAEEFGANLVLGAGMAPLGVKKHSQIRKPALERARALDIPMPENLSTEKLVNQVQLKEGQRLSAKGRTQMAELQITEADALKAYPRYAQYLRQKQADMQAKGETPTPEFIEEITQFAKTTDPVQLAAISPVFAHFADLKRASGVAGRTVPVNLFNMDKSALDIDAIRKTVMEKDTTPDAADAYEIMMGREPAPREAAPEAAVLPPAAPKTKPLSKAEQTMAMLRQMDDNALEAMLTAQDKPFEKEVRRILSERKKTAKTQASNEATIIQLTNIPDAAFQKLSTMVTPGHPWFDLMPEVQRRRDARPPAAALEIPPVVKPPVAEEAAPVAEAAAPVSEALPIPPKMKPPAAAVAAPAATLTPEMIAELKARGWKQAGIKNLSPEMAASILAVPVAETKPKGKNKALAVDEAGAPTAKKPVAPTAKTVETPTLTPEAEQQRRINLTKNAIGILEKKLAVETNLQQKAALEEGLQNLQAQLTKLEGTPVTPKKEVIPSAEAVAQAEGKVLGKTETAAAGEGAPAVASPKQGTIEKRLKGKKAAAKGAWELRPITLEDGSKVWDLYTPEGTLGKRFTSETEAQVALAGGKAETVRTETKAREMTPEEAAAHAEKLRLKREKEAKKKLEAEKTAEAARIAAEAKDKERVDFIAKLNETTTTKEMEVERDKLPVDSELRAVADMLIDQRYRDEGREPPKPETPAMRAAREAEELRLLREEEKRAAKEAEEVRRLEEEGIEDLADAEVSAEEVPVFSPEDVLRIKDAHDEARAAIDAMKAEKKQIGSIRVHRLAKSLRDRDAISEDFYKAVIKEKDARDAIQSLEDAIEDRTSDFPERAAVADGPARPEKSFDRAEAESIIREIEGRDGHGWKISDDPALRTKWNKRFRGRYAEGTKEVNLAEIRNADELRRIVKHERTHEAIDSVEGQKLLDQYVREQLDWGTIAKVAPDYPIQKVKGEDGKMRWETSDEYNRRVGDEALAKLSENRNSTAWKNLVQRVKEFLDSMGIRHLTKAEAEEAILWRLEKVKGGGKGQGGERASVVPDAEKQPYLTEVGLLPSKVDDIPAADKTRLAVLYIKNLPAHKAMLPQELAELNTQSYKELSKSIDTNAFDEWLSRTGYLRRGSSDPVYPEDAGLVDGNKTLRDALVFVRQGGSSLAPIADALLRIQAFNFDLDGTYLEKSTTGKSYYQKLRDKVGLTAIVNDATILHEGSHVITSRAIDSTFYDAMMRAGKLVDDADATGHKYKEVLEIVRMDAATPAPVKRLIELYTSTLHQLGMYDEYLGVGGKAAATYDNVQSKSADTYGLHNIHEFVSEAFSREVFQDRLRKLKGDGRLSVWDSFVKEVTNLINLLTGKNTVTEDMLSSVISAGMDTATSALSPRAREQAASTGLKSVKIFTENVQKETAPNRFNKIVELRKAGLSRADAVDALPFPDDVTDRFSVVEDEPVTPEGKAAAAKPAPERTYEENAKVAQEGVMRSVVAMYDDMAGRLVGGEDTVRHSLLRELLPGTLSDKHLRAAEWVGSLLGKKNHTLETASPEFEPIKDYFAKARVGDKKIPLRDNVGMKFAAMMQAGKVAEMTPEHRKIAETFEKYMKPLYADALKTIMNDPHMSNEKLAEMMLRNQLRGMEGMEKRRGEGTIVHQKRVRQLVMGELSKIPGFAQNPGEKYSKYMERIAEPLRKMYLEQELRRSYFPSLWTRESVSAFHQALAELRESRRNPEDPQRLPNIDILSEPPEVRKELLARVNELKKLGAKGAADNDVVASAFLKRPIEGSKGFLKHKYFTDIMDGIELGLEPFSTNPVDLIQHKRNELAQFILGRTIRNSAKYIPIGVNIDRPGWRVPKDRNFTLTTSGSEGSAIIGRYYLPNAEADIVDAYTSSTLYNHPVGFISKGYKKAMRWGSILNQFQLGMGSWFHAGFMYSEASVSAGANVFKDGYRFITGKGKFDQVARSVKQAAVAAVPYTAYSHGAKMIDAYYKGTADPMMEKVVRAFELGGGRFEMERGLTTNDLSKFKEAWYGGDYKAAGANSLTALSEWLGRPVMKKIVPYHKAAVFTDLAERIIRDNPGKTLEQLTPEFRQAVNRIDARLGQVGYDRLFMNNAAKNAIQLLIRAPGWTGGTIAEIGGGAKDTAKFLADYARTGKLPEQLPDRVAYTLSLMTTMTIMNGLLTALFTDDEITDKDFWAFRTGAVDEKGRPERFVLPTYGKDVHSYLHSNTSLPKSIFTTLGHKVHPIFTMLGQAINNKDFEGKKIYDYDDNWAENMKDLATFSIKQYFPFWMQGAGKELERVGGIGNVDTLGEAAKIAVPFVGVTQAPGSYSKSKAEKLIDEFSNEAERKGLTKREAERYEIRKKARSELILHNDDTFLKKARNEGLLSVQDAREIRKGRNEKPLLYSFKHGSLTIWEAFNVYEVATPEEKDLLRKPLRDKYLRARKEARVADRVDMSNRYAEVMEEK